MRQCRTATERNFASGEQVTEDVAWGLPLSVARAEAVALVKAAAARRILTFLPEHRQRNLTARAVEIATSHPGLSPDQYPEPDRSEWHEGQAMWNRVKALRAASDQLEAAIAALPDSEAVFDFVETMDSHSIWPE